ncbi:MAG: ferrous iron transport protein B [Bacteroidetes bacterium]|nr:MAG: ferrous iron transport protein B [Bacteroidota bacterium]
MGKTKTWRVALAGNPNSGKSSVFNQLTGLRQKVGNFPGVTVEKKVGKARLHARQEITLIDLPGTYSLHPTSEDERIVLNVLANPDNAHYPDAVVYIADITNLEKHFLLLTQIKDLGVPVILALNMTDLAEKEGIILHPGILEGHLNIPVIPISGRSGKNLDALKSAIADILAHPIPPAKPYYRMSPLEKQIIRALKPLFPNYSDYQILLVAHHHQKMPELSSDLKKQVAETLSPFNFQSLRTQIDETMQRFNTFTPVLRKAIQKPPKASQNTLTDKLDRLLVHRLFGPVIFFLIMLLVFQAIYAWSSYPMDWIDGAFGAMGEWLKATLPAGWFTDLLTDGILAGLGGILIFIPQIAILFFLISILEEVGYMARAVFMFDKIMQKFGLNGRSVVALISGGACAIPAIMSTRTISNWKERLITILVTPFISCSARIPVYTMLIGFAVPDQSWGPFNLQGLAFMGLYLLGIVAALGAAWVFKQILRTGEQSFLLLELPQYRPPLWKNVFMTIRSKVGAFVWEAGKVILLISIALWFLANYGPGEQMALAEQEATQTALAQNLSETEANDLLAAKRLEASFAGQIGKGMEPVIRPLGFDWKIGIALLTSFAAREVFVGTMATIYAIGSADDTLTIRERLAQAKNPVTGAPVYTVATSVSLLLFYVFALQCMSTLAVVRKETGSWKWPLIQFSFMTGLAYISAFAAYQFLS